MYALSFQTTQLDAKCSKTDQNGVSLPEHQLDEQHTHKQTDKLGQQRY